MEHQKQEFHIEILGYAESMELDNKGKGYDYCQKWDAYCIVQLQITLCHIIKECNKVNKGQEE